MSANERVVAQRAVAAALAPLESLLADASKYPTRTLLETAMVSALREAIEQARAVPETHCRCGALDALADLCRKVIDVHAEVVMDTPADRELHDRAVATFRARLAQIITSARPIPTGNSAKADA